MNDKRSAVRDEGCPLPAAATNAMIDDMERNGLIIFVKAPGAEHIKSRLAATIGAEKARRLYGHCVADILETADRGNFSLKVFFFPPDLLEETAAWLGTGRSYEPQDGDTLGDRMSNAFEKCFTEGFTSLLLIGSDIPDLPSTVIDRGFADLKQCDAVIGPACDGGYYLIGFTAAAFLPEAFRAIPWGTGDVFESTCRTITDHGLSLSVLPRWRDLDTIEDVKAFHSMHDRTSAEGLKTLQYIESDILPAAASTDTEQK